MTLQSGSQVQHGGTRVHIDHASLTQAGGKFLTFYLAAEEYGFEILKVHEIIGMMPITSVPRTPAFVRGVINLRGKVIPIVDLRLKFDMEAREQTSETCIIVVHVDGMKKRQISCAPQAGGNASPYL
jgi:purine-binding chemotaxis protein CheW